MITEALQLYESLQQKQLASSWRGTAKFITTRKVQVESLML